MNLIERIIFRRGAARRHQQRLASVSRTPKPSATARAAPATEPWLAGLVERARAEAVMAACGGAGALGEAMLPRYLKDRRVTAADAGEDLRRRAGVAVAFAGLAAGGGAMAQAYADAGLGAAEATAEAAKVRDLLARGIGEAYGLDPSEIAAHADRLAGPNGADFASSFVARKLRDVSEDARARVGERVGH